MDMCMLKDILGKIDREELHQAGEESWFVDKFVQDGRFIIGS